MVLFKTLFETLTQTGGVIQPKKNTFAIYIYIFIYAIISLLIKTYLVELSYNYIMPKIISNNSGNPEKTYASFRRLTFGESLILVILVQSLVN